MAFDCTPVRCWTVLLLSGLLLVGCTEKGTPPNVPAGQFAARVNGAVNDTLEGSVHYRTNNDSLTGLELGPENGAGLSIELEPRPPALRTYEVVNWELLGLERPGAPPGVVGFLTVNRAQFESTDGSFTLTYVGDEQVGATFTFQMKGEFGQGPSDVPAVEVTGTLNALPSR